MHMQQELSEDITRLNQQQLDRLRLFQIPMPEQDYNEIKRLVVKTLAKNIDDEWNAWRRKKDGHRKLMNNGERNT